jgi:hypothetical protein
MTHVLSIERPVLSFPFGQYCSASVFLETFRRPLLFSVWNGRSNIPHHGSDFRLLHSPVILYRGPTVRSIRSLQFGTVDEEKITLHFV